jgi:pyruvate ferredoxin oxidoreductase alpha subunit
MLEQIEGSHAVAKAIALCRPESSARINHPQTHIVEGLGKMVKAGKLTNCEFINVESSSRQCRWRSAPQLGPTATATSSQGRVFMAEAVYNAADVDCQ